MNNGKRRSILGIAAAWVMCVALLVGCGSVGPAAGFSSGGTLVLRVNPEIEIAYDENGMVTEIKGRNDDGKEMVASYSGYEGKETRQVVTDLVEMIGEAGYFVEEIEGKNRQIIIEIESGSSLPYEAFLDEVVSDVHNCIQNNSWNSMIDVEGESNYGMSDYVDTDYGPDSDGVTDYDDGTTDYDDGTTDYDDGTTDYDDGTTDYDDGTTDYDDTDYGPDNDGVTDYDDGTTDYNDGTTDYDDGTTDYDDGTTDYDDTDYGPNNDGVTDYDDGTTDYNDGTTDYDDGTTDYNDTDYGPNNDGMTDYDDGTTDYDDTDYGPNNDGVTDYDDGDSGYDDGDSGYDDGDSDYEDGDSGNS